MFRYLRESGCVAVPGIHDQKDFMEVEEVSEGLSEGRALRWGDKRTCGEEGQHTGLVGG